MFKSSTAKAIRFLQRCRLIHSSRDIRNVAIVAHVDHGKTSLVDCLLMHDSSSPGSSSSNRQQMDYNVLERERGITILAKCTSIEYRQHRVNIVDTPGHSDFGGEVERALALVDGIVLVVDATEGPMVQTKNVLGLSLRHGLRPIVVFNKLDRPTQRCDEVDSEVFDLFASFNATDEQLGYPTIFASAKEGWAARRKDGERTKGMVDLLECILKHVPPPKVDTGQQTFSMLVNGLDQSPFLGTAYFGKVASGTVRLGDAIKVLSSDNAVEESRVNQLFFRKGAQLVDVQEAVAGDIISLNGPTKAMINHTICHREHTQCLVPFSINPPTVSMFFYLNDSPLKGTEGKAMTNRLLHDRVLAEANGNLSLQVKPTPSSDCFEVLGRGEMQLGVLAENIRREGFEIAISRPKVLCRTEKGRLMEPVAELTIDCPPEFMGVVIEKLSRRKAELVRNSDVDDKIRLVFTCPFRGLIGYSAEFKNDTHGTGLMAYSFHEYQEHKGAIESSRKGSLISMANGICSRHALSDLDARGTLFVVPGTQVYEGMVIGESSRSMDIEVNPCRTKELSNYRTVLKDEVTRLKGSRQLSLEDMIAYMGDDELIEITPKTIRLRKRDLRASDRKLKSRSQQPR